MSTENNILEQNSIGSCGSEAGTRSRGALEGPAQRGAESVHLSCNPIRPASHGPEDPTSVDLTLVEAVLQKDRKATADFVDTYTDAVYSFIRRRLNPGDDMVDDLVQEVFIAAWENLTSFRGSSSLRGWLLGIARHKVEDHYRRLLQDAHPLEADTAELLPDTSPGVEAAAERERIEKEIRRVLAEMPQHYSIALLWRYWERRSAREVAEKTGRSEKAVERLLARAREQFRRRWQNA